jgi:hypothetical protein
VACASVLKYLSLMDPDQYDTEAIARRLRRLLKGVLSGACHAGGEDIPTRAGESHKLKHKETPKKKRTRNKSAA